MQTPALQVASAILQAGIIQALIILIVKLGQRGIPDYYQSSIHALIDALRDSQKREHETLVLISEVAGKTQADTEVTTVNLSPQTIARVKLVHNLNTFFSLEDIKGLCFYLDINYDSLGEGNMQHKILALLEHIERNNGEGLRRVIKLAKQQRGDLDWPQLKE